MRVSAVLRELWLTEIEHELDDLHDGDVLLPPDADAPGGLKVVPIHDDVDHEVESDGHPGDGGVADQLGVAEQRSCAVVVGVEKRCGCQQSDAHAGSGIAYSEASS